MRITLLYSIVFTFFVFSDGIQQKKPIARMGEQNTKNTMFGDVIKNITRVNNVLEELIQNYEKLKTIYSSQEDIIGNLFSSDGEIDGTYKGANQPGEARLRNNKTENHTTKDPELPATGMFFSEEKANDENDGTDNMETNLSEEDKFDKTIKQTTKLSTSSITTHITKNPKKQPPKAYYKANDNKPRYGRYPKIEFLLSVDPPKNQNLIDKNVPQKKANAMVAKPGKEIVSNPKSWGGSKETRSRTNNQSKYQASEYNSKLDSSSSSSESESESDDSSSEDNKTVKRNRKEEAATTAYKTIKKVVQTEKFSDSNFWHEMVNKPVELKTENEVVYKVYKKPDMYFRNQMPQRRGRMPKLVTVKNKLIRLDQIQNKTHKRTSKSHRRVRKVPKAKTPESVEEDKTIMKEMFKTRVLRKAYGDACLKVVVKKCYKGSKKALKLGCKRYKCKSKFKNTFDYYARESCIQEFRTTTKDAVDIETTTKCKNKSIVAKKTRDFRAPIEDFDTFVDREFEDITRSGYLTAVCLPTAKRTEVRNGVNGNNSEVQLNILRDRFESECKRVSTDKCTHSCEYSVRRSCDLYECKGDRKRYLNKRCRKECKEQYKGYGGSSDSGSGSSDSETESASESDDSDSDSGSSDSSGSYSSPEKDQGNKKVVHINKKDPNDAGQHDVIKKVHIYREKSKLEDFSRKKKLKINRNGNQTQAVETKPKTRRNF